MPATVGHYKIDTHGALSSRVEEVIGWRIQGKTREETGIICGIGERTVKSHDTLARETLDATNEVHLATKLWERGFIQALTLLFIILSGPLLNNMATDNSADLERTRRPRSARRTNSRKTGTNTLRDGIDLDNIGDITWLS